MQQELNHWKKRRILRILIGTSRSHMQQATKKKIEEYFQNEEERKTSHHEYFLYCFKNEVETLFGETFAQMAEAMISRQNLGIKQLLEIRGKKRGPDEAEFLASKASESPCPTLALALLTLVVDI